MSSNKKNKTEELDVQFKTILATGDAYLVSIAKSILEDAKIDFYVKNEQIQNLFGIGSLGGHANPLSGPLEIIVREEDEILATELLKDLLN